MSLNRSLALATVLAASAAGAQTYVVTSISQTYTPLSGATAVTPQGWGGYTNTDDGYATIPLGFSFPYYGGTTTTVGVNTNGLILIDSAAQAYCNPNGGSACYGGTIPSTSSPNGMVAPWWADLNGGSGSEIRYKAVGTTEMDIEFSNWSYYYNVGQFSFTVKLFSSGMIQVHYGSHSGSHSGTASGFENATGTQGAPIVSCGGTSSCTGNDWPTDTLYIIGQPVQPDLIVQQVSTTSTVKTGSDLDISLSAVLRNLGQNDANNFYWKAYLSSDKTLDASDALIYDSQVSGTAVSLQGSNNTANPTLTVTGSGTVTNVTPGNYYVLVEVDTTNAVTEFTETNNMGSTQSPFTFGFDLVADSISGPTPVQPDDVVTMNLGWHNAGTDASNGPLKFRIVVSLDQVLSMNDTVVEEWTESVAGTQTCAGASCTHTFTIPGTIPGGDYYWGLVVDGDNAMGATGTTLDNNAVFASSKVHVDQSDLDVQFVDLVDSLTKLPTRIGNIGENGELRVTLSNTGGAPARNFQIGVMISRDASPSLLNDNLVKEVLFPVLLPGETQTVDIVFPIPTSDSHGLYATGNYYIYALMDVDGDLTELSEFNNSRAVGGAAPEPINLRLPAADYAAVKIDAPSTAAVGEVVPVYRVIKNQGNKDGGKVTYRYFASANEISSTEDIPLLIVGANGQPLDSADITLAKGETDARTEFVRLPPTMPAGTWYLGIVVDVTNSEPEFEEANNANVTSTQVQVAPSAMSIANQQLPDATVDVPYAFQLAASGATGGAITWREEGTLPDGLLLSPQGVLSGTPKASSISSFTVFAESGTSAAAARLVMRVLPSSGELAVVTTNLPPVINSPSMAYKASLAAAGGSVPYHWALTSGALPNGIKLAKDGTLSGTIKPGVAAGEFPIVVQVADDTGNAAFAQLKVRVVETGALLISSMVAPDTIVGTDYIADFAAQNADGNPLAAPLSWNVVSGRLPEGLTLTVAQNTLGLVTGKAVEAGTFPFSLQVVDAKGRSDVADYVLNVLPARLKLAVVNQPTVVHPGDEVSFQITTGNPDSRFQIYAGVLPPGLKMNEQGAISGTVDMENSVGTWNYVVEAKSAAAGESLGSFSLEVTPAPVKTGCAAAPGNGFGALLLLAPLAGLLARKRRGVAVAAVAAMALAVAPSAANAQTTQYTLTGPTTQPYVALQKGTALAVDSWLGQTVTIPFDFKFYGTTYTQVGVSLHGYLAFSGSLSYSNWGDYGIPVSYPWYSGPDQLIAAWWGDLYKGSTTTVKTFTYGDAPNREFVVEWNKVCSSYSCTAATQFSFQVHLYEGSNKIRLAYGTGTATSNSAVGIMASTSVGLPGLSCTTASSAGCGSASFPAGKVLDFSPPSDLLITGLSVDNIGYAGVPFQAAATLNNRGGLDARGSNMTGPVVRFYLSSDPVLDPATDTVIGDTTPQVVPVLTQVVQTGTLTIPSSVVPGTYFLFAQADPTNDVLEEDEGNNATPPMIFTVGEATPNLQVASITAPETAGAAASFQVPVSVVNVGNADTTVPAKISYFVSDNSVVTVSDVLLSTTSVDPLAAGGTAQLNDTVTLPADLPAGRYWIGACVDYDPSADPRTAITEISEVDNCTTGNSFVLNTGALAVISTTLPDATQNGAYGLRLEAVGGDGTYAWSLDGGALPPGVSLSAGGDLVGTPSEAGTYTFTVKVASAGEEKTQALSLNVQPFDLPLYVVAQTLPVAEFGRGYQVQLVAKGGKPPYAWTLQDGSSLPEGLGMSRDGFIEGRASQARDNAFVFTVVATDAAGTQAAADLQLSVVIPSSMHIATSRLKTAYLGSNYVQDLQAIGGRAPYSWSVIRFQKLAQTATDVPGAPEAKLPDGFGLVVDNSNSAKVASRLTGKPAMAGMYSVTLQVFDNDGASDVTTLPLTVSYDKPLAITTTVLPEAFAGQPYSVRVSHNGGKDVTATFSNPCIQQASTSANGFTYACVTPDASQQLPPGLTLAADGSITGTPTALPAVAAAADGTTSGPESATYSFLVKVEDPQGRADVRSLSIKVHQPVQEAKSGCSGTGLEPAAMALFALAGLIRRRRK